MLDKILQSILRKYFGEFLTGIQSIQLGIWSGKIFLENTSLKHDKINAILQKNHIPLSLKYSSVGSLAIDIPWNKLLSAPIQIKINNIFMVLKIDKVKSVEKRAVDEKISLIKSYAEEFMKKALKDFIEQKGEENSKQPGYTQKIILKIINNLNFLISKVSVRIQGEQDYFMLNQETDHQTEQQMSDQRGSTRMQASKLTQSRRESGLTIKSREFLTLSDKKKKKELAFGFCIENFSSNTIDESKNPKFYSLQNQKSPLLKLIKLSKISVYWQQQNKLQLFKHNFQQKNRLLESLINRRQNRLLTVDGDLMVRKNQGKLNYLFETTLQTLEIQSTYSQLEGMMKVYSNFSAASKSKFLSQMEQLAPKEQAKLKSSFQKIYPIIWKHNFNRRKCSEEFAEFQKILKCVSKKNLLYWVKQSSIEIVKLTKLQNLKKIKNKKGWFGFLADRAQIDLTEEDKALIQKQVEYFLSELQTMENKKMQIGFNFDLKQLNIQISHLQMRQLFSLKLFQTEFRYAYLKDDQQIFLQVADVKFIYLEQKKGNQTHLLKRFIETEKQINQSFFTLEIQLSREKLDINFKMNEIEINHESHVLFLVNQLIKLKKKEDNMGSDVVLKKLELNLKKQQQDNPIYKAQRIYGINITLKTIKFNIEVSESSYLVAIIEGITVYTSQQMHKGTLLNLNLLYRKGKNNENPILKNFTINLLISNSFKQISTIISKLSLILCEDDLRNIYRNFKKQFQVFISNKTIQNNKVIDQVSLMQGSLKTLTVFKDWRKYYAKLSQDSLYFYSCQQSIDSQSTQTALNVIPLRNTTVAMETQCRFKIISDDINELIECQKQVCENWVEMIEKVIFQCSSRQKIYNMINGKQKKLSFSEGSVYEKEYSILIQTVSVTLCQTIGRNISQFAANSFSITLKEDDIKFMRAFDISSMYIKNSEQNINSDLIYLVSTTVNQNQDPTPLSLRISGKKKVHPEYKGEISIGGNLSNLKVNYDSQFIYRIIKRIAWNFEVPSYTKQMRDNKILQLTKKYLQSPQYHQSTQKVKSSNPMDDDFSNFLELSKFKQYNTANVMLKVDIEIDNFFINLLNGRNHTCIFQGAGSGLNIKIDKGTTFMFVKIAANDFRLYDTTNYPNTTPKAWKISENPYPLIFPQKQRNQKQCFQCSFSSYSLEKFMNKDRIRSFFVLKLFDMEINYQNQPILRFVDYLLTHFIGFIMSPHQLHKFDGPIRGPFKYFEFLDLTEKQVKAIISSSINPFFTKLVIKAHNFKANFNSHPNQENIPILIEDFKFESYNYSNPDRIRFKNNELKKIQKNPFFQQLIEIEAFQSCILKNQWSSKFGIVASGCTSPIIQNSFELSLIIERVVNSDKGIIFPFVEINSDIICKSWIQNLSIKGTKSVYNLINRCILHNVSYDDKCDKHYYANFQFRSLVTSNELYYSLKAKQLSIVIPELDIVIAIPEFQYIFVKHPTMRKQMYIYGKSLNILGNQESLMMPRQQNQQQYNQKSPNRNSSRLSNIKANKQAMRSLEYYFDIKADGSKAMSAILRQMEIKLDLKKYMSLLQYFLLDQSCYPLTTDFSDLPLIICEVSLKRTFIKLLTVNASPESRLSEENIPDLQKSYEYIGAGDINFTWTRNKVMHPERYKIDPSLFPFETQQSSYKIILKDFLLRKYQTIVYKDVSSLFHQNYENQIENKFIHFRSLSNSIFTTINISQVMRLSPACQKYCDNIFTIDLHSFMLKICYRDIDEIMVHFSKKDEKEEKNSSLNENIQSMQQNKQSNSLRVQQEDIIQLPEQQIFQTAQKKEQINYSRSKYSIKIKKFSVQFGVSELPVPILDLTLKNSNLEMEFIGLNKIIILQANVFSSYWNMKIGKWEPIIQRFVPKINLRLGSPSKHIIMDCHQPLYIDISVEALRVLSILNGDIQEKGKFSVIRNQSNSNQTQGNNVSPYILTNKVGCPLKVSSDLIKSTKLNSDEKMYIDLQSLNIQKEQSQVIYFKVIPNSEMVKDMKNIYQKSNLDEWNEKQLRLDEAVTKKITIRSATNNNYPLYLKIITTAIMKQLIISSPYQIENRTAFTFILKYDNQEVQVDPGEKKAINFMANMKKNLKIDFPSFLQTSNDNIMHEEDINKLRYSKIIENCEFPFEILFNGYEHQIIFDDGKTFNCVISIDEDPQMTIVVQPALYIKNLLPFDVPIEFLAPNQKGQKMLYSYGLDINEQKSIHDFNNQGNMNENNIPGNSKKKVEKIINIRIKIRGFNFSPFQSILEPNNAYQYRNNLDLIDYRGSNGKISMKVLKDGKVRRIYFYSEAVLLDQTKFNWFAFVSGNRLVPGQKLKQNITELKSPYILINQNTSNSKQTSAIQKNISFGFREEVSNSNQISFVQISLQEASVFNGSAIYQFTIKNTLTCLDNIGRIYSNILKAQPKYVIVNQTNNCMQLAQNNVFTKIFTLRPDERKNWYWPNKSEQKNIVLKLIENQVQIPNQEWDYSAPINLLDVQEKVLVLRPKSDKDIRKLLTIVPIFQYQSTFILIKEVKDQDDHLVTIKNQLKLCKLNIYQEIVDKNNPIWIGNKYFEIGPNSKGPFGWDYPNSPQTLVVFVSFLSYMKSQFKPFIIKIDTNIQRTQKFAVNNQDDQIFEIKVQVQIIGLRKVITFQRKEHDNEQEDEFQLMQSGDKLGISFSQIGVSLIGNKNNAKNCRVQILYLSLQKLQVIMMQKKSSRTLQVKIKYINIDNNMDHNTIYPILLTPLKHEKTLRKSRPFFVMILQQTIGLGGGVKQIKEFRVCLEPISLKIHDQILVALVQMFKVVGKIKNDDKGSVDLIPIYRAYYLLTQWQQQQLLKPTRDIFIRELEIARLALEITFSIRPKFNSQNFIITTILSSFGVAISNVSEAQLTLSRFSKKDNYFSQIKHELTDFYLKQFIKGIYKILGSINLFGNPYVLISMFAEGTWEIINQPTEGFIKGPIEGAFGIVKGGVYFSRNLVAGTCNSFEAISESISRGVASMTMDEKFIERRQKIKRQKSEHLIKGIQYGGFAIYTGFQVAITGLVRHPMQGYEQQGALGGFTGTLKGLAGLITKPVSGTFEGISKISQGIKNTALLFQDGPISKRQRHPRIFISELQYYKAYSPTDSLAMSILQKSSTKYLNSQIYFISTLILPDKEIKQCLILTNKYFSKVDLETQKILIDLQIDQLEEMTLYEHSLVIRMSGGMLLTISQGKFKQLYTAFKKIKSAEQESENI